MKLRVINNAGLFVPQQLRKSAYSHGTYWSGFGIPTIKFLTEEKAVKFAKLIEDSVGGTHVALQQVCVYQNFQNEDKKAKR